MKIQPEHKQTWPIIAVAMKIKVWFKKKEVKVKVYQFAINLDDAADALSQERNEF